MRSKFRYFREKYFDYSMLRWGLVGLTTTVVDYTLFIYLYGTLNSVFIANLLSATVATSTNYIAHHRWTFRSDQQHSKSGIKYLLNLTFWWVVSTTIIKVMILLNLDPRLAKLVPLILIAPINYFVLNILVFKKIS
jgi:putative flippase GtrA